MLCPVADKVLINAAADEVKDYRFNWVIPEFAGTYMVEVGLAPAELTAYDVDWLEVA
jgi:hypothetical protein